MGEFYEYWRKHPHIFKLKYYADYGFKEISGGIYLLLEDKFRELDLYVDSQTVISKLNSENKVMIELANGNIATNFDVYKCIREE